MISALCASAAAAGNVAVVTHWQQSEDDKNYRVLSFVAAGGEANRLTMEVAYEIPSYVVHVTFTDPGAPIGAGEGCVSRGAHEAVCTVDSDEMGFSMSVETNDLADEIEVLGSIGISNQRTWIEAGPGNDTITVRHWPTDAWGEAGNDRLIGDGDGLPDSLYGGDGADIFQSGGGSDSVHGGRGNDVVDAGPGNDYVVAGPGDDVIRGGTGRDRLSYGWAPRRVIADLADGSATGEGLDTLTDIEILVGSRFADRLSGDAGANRLFGLEGNDVIRGRRGDDRLNGGSGSDVLGGGAGGDRLYGWGGNDFLRARDGERDHVSGNAGRDRASVDPIDQVSVERIL